MRTMILEIDDLVLYYSTFDERTGATVRSAEQIRYEWQSRNSGERERMEKLKAALRKSFPKRYTASVPSPSPELVDISITNKCDMNCSFCYQDSKTSGSHAKTDLVETTLTGFKHVPYQICIGGGEPTLHPEFIQILYKAREIGTIPNYTTAGYNMTPEILEATDKVCGGVAITYHPVRGIEWFKKHYKNIRENLTCQVNVHLLADNNIINGLTELIKAQKEIGKLNLVLLAFYPEVGRSKMSGLMTKTQYNKQLPELLARAIKSGMKISFSEGLLPYFISRPEIGVSTELATASEGNYSCYIDCDGNMAKNSFSSNVSYKTVWEKPSQELWQELDIGWANSGGSCYGCEHESRCTPSTDYHYLLCRNAGHN